MRAGLSREEALRQARVKLGGLERTKEECRDALGVSLVESAIQDARFGLRMLRKNPGFTAAAMITLALGIALTTVMFTVLNGVLLTPLSYTQPDRLIAIHDETQKYGEHWGLSYPDFLDSERESHAQGSMAAWAYGGGTISEKGVSEYVDGRLISSELFSVLGIPLLRGRAFLQEEDQPGATPVIIISYGLWQRRYGGSEAAIGGQLLLEAKPYTIVGVAPAGFALSGEQAEVYTPLGQWTDPRMRNREARILHVAARLRAGLSLPQAQAELAVVSGALAKAYPKSDEGHAIVAQPLREELVGDIRPTLWLLLSAAGLLLLIGCVNVASLLLSRAVSREREFAVRRALGASRIRLARQCVTESGILALCGGLLGLLLTVTGIHPFVTFWPGSLPRAGDIHIDWRVLVFVLIVSIFCGLLFGVAPALSAPEEQLETILRAEGRTTTSSRRLHGSFVAGQVALALVLLFSAGMLANTVVRLSSLNPGINVKNLLAARVEISPEALARPAETRAAWQDFLDRVRRVPGVRSAALADIIPMREGENPLPYSTTAALPPESQMPIGLTTTTTPDFLAVMGIQLRQGRFFNDGDRMGTKPVVVIDDILARHAFSGRSAVGQLLWVPALGRAPVEIVGVVGHVRHWGLASDDQSLVRDQIYCPFAQIPDSLMGLFSSVMSVAVRTDLPPLSVAEGIKREAGGGTSGGTLYEIRTMEELASASISRQRFLLILFSTFAGLALVLACIGIYGVLSYLTNQRVREIGVRMALGAGALNVMWLVIGQSLGMIAIGIGAGTVAALAAGHVLEHFVAGVGPNDLLTFLATASVLILAAILASYIPARRATRVDPMVALRHE